MGPPLVTCTSCQRSWNSATMAEGLREVGTCPRCGGGLRFADATPAPVPAASERVADENPETPPHLVLGAPRR